MNNSDIQTKFNNINNTIRTLINNSNSIYSQHSKESELLSVGNCSLTIDSSRKSFTLRAGNDKIIITPLTHNIGNLEYINDIIKVSDLLTVDSWINSEKVQEILGIFATKDEIDEIYGWIKDTFNKTDILTVNSDTVINGTLNGLDINEILTPERILSNKELLDTLSNAIMGSFNDRVRVLEVDLHIRTNKYRIKMLEEYYS